MEKGFHGWQTVFQSPYGDFGFRNYGINLGELLVDKCFSPLTGILGLETVEFALLKVLISCFSPLTGILGLETFLSLPSQQMSNSCFSPLTGILGLETFRLILLVLLMLLWFQSPYGDFGFRNSVTYN